MNEAELRILISARDRASRVMRQVRTQTERLRRPLSQVNRTARLVGVGFRLMATGARAAYRGIGLLGTAARAAGGALRSLVFGPIGLLVAGVVAAGAGLTSLAANLGEARNLAQVTFGDSAKAVEEFAATADTAFGLTEEAALQYAGTLGVIIDGSIDNQAAAADMSIELLKVAADLSSINNIPIDVALEKLRAGLVGETEPLRTVGVLLSDQRVRLEAVRLGLARTTKEVNDASKVQARYSLILRDTERAQGDFARTSRDLPNLLRRARAAFGNLAAEIGQELLPVATELVQNVFDWMIRNRQEIVRFARDGIGRIVDFARRAADVAGRLRLALADYWSANGDRLVENFKALADAATSFAAALGAFVSQNADKLTALFRFIADNSPAIVAVLGARIALGGANNLTGGAAGGAIAGVAQGTAAVAARAVPWRAIIAAVPWTAAAAAIPWAVLGAAAAVGGSVAAAVNVTRAIITGQESGAPRTRRPSLRAGFDALDEFGTSGISRGGGGGRRRSSVPFDAFDDLANNVPGASIGYRGYRRFDAFDELADNVPLTATIDQINVGSRTFRAGAAIPELDFLAAMGIPPELHIRANIILGSRLSGQSEQAFSESFATTRNALAATDPDLALFGDVAGLSDPGASAEQRRGFAQRAGRLDTGGAGGGGGGGGFRFVIEATEEWEAALDRVRETGAAVFETQVAIAEQQGVVSAAQDEVTAATERYAAANDAVEAKRRQIVELDREILTNQRLINKTLGIQEAALGTAEIESHIATFRLGLLEEAAAAAGGIANVTLAERARIDEVVEGYRLSRDAELELNAVRIAAAAAQGAVARLQRQAERDALVEQAELLAINAGIAGDALDTAQKTLQEEIMREAVLRLELDQRLLLNEQAALGLEIVTAEQMIERDITLDYIERSRLLDDIITKRREVELIDIRTRDLRRELAREAAKAATPPVQITVELDKKPIATAVLSELQAAFIRGTGLGIN